MFKVNNKNTESMSMAFFYCVSIDFEQVNICWDRSSLTTLNINFFGKRNLADQNLIR